MAVDFPVEIRALRQTFSSILEVSDLGSARQRIAELSEAASAPDLWNDPDRAQAVTSKLSHLQSEVERVERMGSRIDDLEVLVELAESEDDEDTLAEAERELASVTKSLGELEVRTLLSGEYDEREALVTIRSGGRRRRRRRLRRDAHAHVPALGRAARLPVARSTTPPTPRRPGIKSATFEVTAPYAYGTLSVEQGTHRLVRISPFDNQGRRQTSFADVEVLPVVEKTDHIDIPENDIRVDVYRSSGPGGQSVNTTDSAVRLTHLPTGHRRHLPEREVAAAEQGARAARPAGQAARARPPGARRPSSTPSRATAGSSWGNQMRSYVLHPYQMVKDLRTEYEIGNPTAVFDGDIDEFLEAGIRWRRHSEKD